MGNRLTRVFLATAWHRGQSRRRRLLEASRVMYSKESSTCSHHSNRWYSIPVGWARTLALVLKQFPIMRFLTQVQRQLKILVRSLTKRNLSLDDV